MSTYDSQIKAFATFGMDAIEKLEKDYVELFLSLNVRAAIEAIVSYTRLYAVELETPMSTEEMYAILEKALADLLAAGKIQISDFGPSDIGRAQYDKLIGLSEPVAEPVAPPDPREEFSDVIAAFSGPVTTLNEKMKNKVFRSRFDKAVELNLI